MGIAMPMLLLFLFGYALTLDVDRVPLIVWDQSNTHESRELLSRFSGSRYFSLRTYTDNYRDIDQAINSRGCRNSPHHPDGFRPSRRFRQKDCGAGPAGRKRSQYRNIRPRLCPEYCVRLLPGNCYPPNPTQYRKRSATRSARSEAARLVQYRHGLEKLSLPRTHRSHHDDHRRTPYLPDRCPGMGDRNHGTAHLNPSQGPGTDLGQAHPLLHHRHP